MTEDQTVKSQEADRGRRAFLAAGAAATGFLAIAPGIHLIELAQARPAGELASSKVRWGLLIDTTRCKAECQSCAKACAKENALAPGAGRPSQNSQWLRKIDLKDKLTGRAVSLPMMCQHCAKPPCVDVCPTGASMQRADGIVLVDRHICIGCRYCIMACPYQARSFVHEPLHDQKPEVPRGQGCVEGCTLCIHRVDKGQMPACVDACHDTGGGAMLFGDLNDPASEIAKRIASVASSQVRAELRLNPAVRYQGI